MGTTHGINQRKMKVHFTEYQEDWAVRQLKNILVQKVDALLTLIIANDGQRFFCLI
jgi:hypothetical protein